MTFAGEPRPVFPEGPPCVWWDWVDAARDAAGTLASWRTRSVGAGDLVARTPFGRLALQPVALRAHLTPARDTTGPGATGELHYCIEAGRTYHARIATELDVAPAMPDAPYLEERLLVLQVSDVPFAEHPTTPVTPSQRRP